ncbi:hypothetical protein F4804DRAFT_336516 [Jackrogersella minutella]|nr:hypothetical protein F4804DRAFT_336516 [Jackrogersella minutella]
MVGKVWSEFEEKYFWKTAVAHSSKRAGVDRANPEKTWDQLASEMHRVMERNGQVRRQYTSTMLFEHYFQNIEGERRSPNAAAYVNQYLKKLGPHHEIVNPRASRPRRAPKSRVRKAPSNLSLPSPVYGKTAALHDGVDVASTESASPLALNQVSFPVLRPVPSSYSNQSLHRFSHPSRYFRPILPADSLVRQSSPPKSPICNDLPHTNQQQSPSCWTMNAPLLSSTSTSNYYPLHSQADTTSRHTTSDSAEELTWGYQMGKRPAFTPLSTLVPAKSLKTSAAGFATRTRYPADKFAMREPFDVDSFSLLSATPSQNTIMSRTLYERSTNGPKFQQQELPLDYQFGQHSSTESLCSYYSTSTSQSPALTQNASHGSIEESLFVGEDEGYNEGEVSTGDENAGGEENTKDIGAQPTTNVGMGAQSVGYQEFNTDKFASRDVENIDYDDVNDGNSIPRLSTSY